jgi:hypothetical protein
MRNEMRTVFAAAALAVAGAMTVWRRKRFDTPTL